MKPQEVNSLVENPRGDNPASGNSLLDVFRNLKHMRTASNPQKLAKMRLSGKESLLG